MAFRSRPTGNLNDLRFNSPINLSPGVIRVGVAFILNGRLESLFGIGPQNVCYCRSGNSKSISNLLLCEELAVILIHVENYPASSNLCR